MCNLCQLAHVLKERVRQIRHSLSNFCVRAAVSFLAVALFLYKN